MLTYKRTATHKRTATQRVWVVYGAVALFVLTCVFLLTGYAPEGALLAAGLRQEAEDLSAVDATDAWSGTFHAPGISDPDSDLNIGGTGYVQSLYVEVGDIAAARAFVALR